MPKYIIFCLFFIIHIAYANPVDYVNNKQCLNCHQSQAKQWKQSDHYFSMLPANEKTVLGNFNNAKFKTAQQSVLFYKQKKKFKIKVSTKSGNTKTYTVKYTFGYHPLQQYLVEFPNGKLQAFNIAWDSIKKHWFNLANNEDLLKSSPLHWSKRFYTWNHACADCHSTNFKKNFDGQNYHSSYSGINVNCQACHGPGSKHIKWLKDKTIKSKGLIVDFKSMNNKQQVELCAHCHSRRAQISDDYKHAVPFNEQYIPATLRPDLYYADGQIKDEVFVYGSFIQSKMYQQGVSCVDCHNPHSLKINHKGNKVCTQCHNNNPKKRYPTLKTKDYDSPKHTHHKANSQASQCVNCHMPETVYMKVDPRRDHSFKVPNPKISINTDIPNACNNCHKDKTPQWAADYVKKWYARNYQNSPVLINNDNRLIAIATNENEPEIFRASSINLLNLNNKKSIATLIKALNSSSVMVKYAALNKLSVFPARTTKKFIQPLLNDKNKVIRATAASIIASAQDDSDALYNKAIQEYESMQHAVSDQPESYVNLARLALKFKDQEKAIQLLKRAILVDKHFVPAYVLLTQIYSIQQRESKVNEVLVAGLKANPKAPSLYYSQGLYYAHIKQFEKAKVALDETLSLDPNFPRAALNLSLVHLKLNKPQKALETLKVANQNNPNDIDILNTLISIYVQQKNHQQATIYLKKLLKLQPNNFRARMLLRKLQSR
jgi:tetratricopeptide (TPR) repeat protein